MDEIDALLLELGRQAIAEAFEEDRLILGFFQSLRAVDVGDAAELVLGEIEALPTEVLVTRHIAEGCSSAVLGAPVDAIHDPFEHAHIFAESGPDEFAVRVLAEPVDAVD